MNNAIKFIGAFLIGGAMGLAAGLLAAPTSGKQTRKKLGKKSKKLARQMAGYIGMEDKFPATTTKRKNGKATVEA